MRECLLSLLLLCCIGTSYSQGLYEISGKVLDKDKKALEFASVVLSDNETKKLIGTTILSH